ncbi:MAG: hypothetical protein K1X72_10180 [Pyrinomonadaceae bacterium]|nr:hypothetical protein [Pyrinomonadaceae bacterium]
MKMTLNFKIFIPMILIIGLLTISAAAFTPKKAQGYWKYSGKQILWVEPFLPEKVTVIRDLPWNKVFSKVVNGGEMSTTYLGQEYDLTRRYQSKYWSEPIQTRRFTWSRLPDIIKPGDSYPISVESSGNGFGSLDITRFINTEGSKSWLATAVRSKVNLVLKTDAPQNLQNPEKRMIYIQMGCGASGTDTFNYAAYVYIYKWVNG